MPENGGMNFVSRDGLKIFEITEMFKKFVCSGTYF